MKIRTSPLVPICLVALLPLAAKGEALAAESSWKASDNAIIAMAFSPDGKRLATIADEGTLTLWDAATHQAIGTIGELINGQNVVRFTPDGKTLLALGRGDTLARLDGDGKALPPIAIKSVPGGTAAFDVSPDGKTVAVVGRGSLRILSIDDGAELKSWVVHENYGIAAAAFAPDGKTVVTAGTDRKANVIDWASGNIPFTFDLHGRGVAAAFSHDGKRVFVAGDDGSLQALDIAGGQANDFTSFRGMPYALVASPDDQVLYVASGGRGPVQLAIAKGDPMADAFAGDGMIKAVAVSPDGKTLAGGANDGTIYLWKPPAR